MTLKKAVIWSPTYGIWYITTKPKLLYSNIYTGCFRRKSRYFGMGYYWLLWEKKKSYEHMSSYEWLLESTNKNHCEL